MKRNKKCSNISGNDEEDDSQTDICSICGNKPSNTISLFQFPSYKKSSRSKSTEDEILKQSLKRRVLWIKAVSASGQYITDLGSIRICSEHFVTGKPAKFYEFDHVDWVPKLNLQSNRKNIKNKAKIKQESISSDAQQQEVENLCVIPENNVYKFQTIDSTNDAISVNEDVSEYDTSSNIQRIIDNVEDIKEEFVQPDYYKVEEDFDVENNFDFDYDVKNVELFEEQSSLDEHNYYSAVPSFDEIFDEHKYAKAMKTPCLPLPFFCHICCTSFCEVFSLTQHVDQHIKTNELTCFYCNALFSSAIELNEHYTSHKVLCHLCGSLVPERLLPFHQNLKIIKAENSDEQDPLAMDTTTTTSDNEIEKVYFCVFCLLPFNNKSQYMLHMHNRHENSIGKIYKCTLCDAALHQRGEFIRHLESHGPIVRNIDSFNQSSVKILAPAVKKKPFKILPTKISVVPPECMHAYI